ncbi:MAG TPA: flagellar basal body-associated FliL family protein [Caulobacteraceae bacterium]|jgi:flagellar FliL protein|nr:flagellar basal body-associated FliL family protein [Caulobacteraceae bacterium]
MLFKKKKPKGGEEAPAEGEAPAVAPADAEGAEGEGAPRKKKKLPIMLIAIVAGVLVLGGGGTGAFFMFQPKSPAAAAADAAKAKKDKKKKDEKGGEGAKKDDKNAPVIRDGPDGVTFYTLPDQVVNIQSADGKPTFLKLKLTFEMHDADTADALTDDAPRLEDMFTSFLRELRPEDLSGSQGSYQLKMEIQRRVNLILAPRKVDGVLIEEMLIQ